MRSNCFPRVLPSCFACSLSHISYFLYCSLNFAKHVVFPTPASPTSVNGIYSATMLGALAGITSGDNNNGLLANPPASNHGGYDSSGAVVNPGATTFNIIKTENPYFTSGYGELDKYGRLLVNIYIDNNKKSVNEWLINEKYGQVYTGGKKKSWDEKSLTENIKPTSPNDIVKSFLYFNTDRPGMNK